MVRSPREEGGSTSTWTPLIVITLFSLLFLPSASAITYDLLSGIAHYWEANNNVTDRVKSNDFTLQNGATYNASGILGAGFDLDGTNDYLSQTEITRTALGGNDWTLQTWVYMDEGSCSASGHTADTIFMITGKPADSPRLLVWCVDGGVSYPQLYFYSSTGDTMVKGDEFEEDQWYHIIAQRNGNDFYLWVDGVQVNTTTDAVTYAGADALNWGVETGQTRYHSGNLDEIGMWNRSLNSSEISWLYNSGGGRDFDDFNQTSPPTGIATTCQSPADEDHDNSNPQTFTFDVDEQNAGGNANCTLWTYQAGGSWTAHTNATGVEFTNGTGKSFSNTYLAEGVYSWLVECYDASSAHNCTGDWNLTQDYTRPIANLEATNFFVTGNTTTHDRRTDGDTGQLNISINDTYLYGYNITIRTGSHSGTVYWTEQEDSLAVSSLEIENTTSMGSWPVDEDGTIYYVNLSVTDDHTAKWWDFTGGNVEIHPQTLRITTPEGVTCSINNKRGNLKGITWDKISDRINWTFSTTNARNDWEYNINCDQPMNYRGDLYAFPAWVVGGVNWIDYDVGDATYTVTKVNDQSYDVLIETPTTQDKLSARSIGGLNEQTRLWTFNLTESYHAENLTRASYNLSWINLSWDLSPGTTHAELWRNGTLVYNGTATDYNDTGRPRHERNYQYVVYGHNGTWTGDTGGTLATATWRPDQLENLTLTPGIDWIRAVWNWTHGATGAFLYRDTTLVLNMTNTSENYYNDTGLNATTSYTYTIYSVATNGSQEYNVSNTSSENQQTAQTVFNSTVFIEIRNEVTDDPLNGVNVTVSFLSNLTNITQDTTTGLLDITNIPSYNYTVRHTADGWGLRDRYLEVLNNTAQNLTLYLLNTSTRTVGVVTVQNTQGELTNGAVVRLLRYYATTNTYNVVQAATMTGDGSATMTAEMYDAFYKWVVEVNGATVYLSPSYEALAPDDTTGFWYKTFTFEDNNAYFRSLLLKTNATHTFVFHNTTRTLTLTWNDPGGDVTGSCIVARYANGTRWEELKNCGSGSTGSINLLVPNENLTYHVASYYRTGYEYSLHQWSTITLFASRTHDFGLVGSFFAGAFILGGALVFSFNIAIMLFWVVGAAFFFTFAPFMRFLPFSGAFIIGLLSIVVGALLFIKRRAS